MEKLIFIADDDQNIRNIMQSFLTGAGYAVRAFPDGDSLLRACETQKPDLVILDIMMPGTDGLTVCSRLRAQDAMLPLIIVSARDDPYDRVTGLSLGSDDYLIKPFLPLELVARVHALFRRSAVSVPANDTIQTITFGDLTLDEKQRTAVIGSISLSLSPLEFDFLLYLMRRSDRAVSREELLCELWQYDRLADTRAADDMLKRLRRKLRENGCKVQIETVWGFGFRLRKEN